MNDEQPSPPIPLPPCYRCRYRETGENSILCTLDQKFPEPLFTAIEWHKPDFLCFQEKADESHNCRV